MKLEEALPCTCGTGTDSHSEGCPARHRPAVQSWHEAQVAEKDAALREAERMQEFYRLRSKDQFERAEAAESQVAEKDARIAELEDRAENLLIAIGMGWDLGGCADRLNGLLPDRAALTRTGGGDAAE